jgi:hypothetical protein
MPNRRYPSVCQNPKLRRLAMLLGTEPKCNTISAIPSTFDSIHPFADVRRPARVRVGSAMPRQQIPSPPRWVRAVRSADASAGPRRGVAIRSYLSPRNRVDATPVKSAPEFTYVPNPPNGYAPSSRPTVWHRSRQHEARAPAGTIGDRETRQSLPRQSRLDNPSPNFYYARHAGVSRSGKRVPFNSGRL